MWTPSHENHDHLVGAKLLDVADVTWSKVGDQWSINTFPNNPVDQKVRDGTLFSAPAVMKSFLGTKLAGYEREIFVTLSLNARHRFLDFVELFHGMINGAEKHPQKVVKRALEFNAAAVIIAHNHLSMTLEDPSFPPMIYARLVETKDGAPNLIWTHSKGD